MDTTHTPSFGALLQRHRHARGFTQEDLAERAGLSVRELAYLEREKHAPRPGTVRRLARALELSDEDHASLLASANADIPQGHHDPSTAHATKVRTFLIADVRDYTPFTLEQGDVAAARLAAQFAALARTAVGVRGGDVVELRGDEVLAAFNSTRQALWAAVELQGSVAGVSLNDPSLPIRVGIGLDAGEAIAVEGGYRGAALNLAARLSSLAEPGEILASETVTHLARKLDGLDYRERGLVQLKGFADPVKVMEIAPVDVSHPQAGASVSSSLGDAVERERQHLPIGGFLGSLPADLLVARDTELAQILTSVDAVAQGEGRTVLLAGEPGAGKTRLAQEVTLAVRDGGFLIAAGRCYETEATVPYYPFLDAFAQLHERAPAPIRESAARRWPYLQVLLPNHLVVSELWGGSQDEQQRVFFAAAAFLQAVAEAMPIALLLDDLHWADAASVKLLQHLTRNSRSSRVLVLGTYRDAEVGRDHPLEGALRDLTREGLVRRVNVNRLPEDGTAALVAAMIGESAISDEFARLVHQRTEGNPYFVQQVVRVLVERGDVYHHDGEWARRTISAIDVPESIRSVVTQRLSRLSEAAQWSLKEASVLGQNFQFGDLETVSGRPKVEIEDAIDEAEEAGMVRERGRNGYAFDHALTQQALYGAISARRRRRLHHAAGEAIEALPAARRDQRAAELAWHFLEGDEPVRALPYAIRAGDNARAVFAHNDAEMQYGIALELAREAGDERQEVEVLQKLGMTRRLAGRYAEALEPLERAATLFRHLGDRANELHVVAEIGRSHGLAGTADNGLERVRPVVMAIEGSEADSIPPACAAALYLALAQLYASSGKYRDLLPAAEVALRWATKAAENQLVAEAQVRRAHGLLFAGRTEEAREALRAALEPAEEAGDLSTLAIGLNLLGNSYTNEGRMEEAITYLQRSLEVLERLGDPARIAFARVGLGVKHEMGGNWEEARKAYERALRESRTTGLSWHTPYPLLNLGGLLLSRGEHEAGERYMHEALAIAESNDDLQALIKIHGTLGIYEVLDGRLEEALARLVPIEERTRRDHRELNEPLVAWAYMELGYEDEAAEILAKAREQTMDDNVRVFVPWLASVETMLAIRQKRWNDAKEELTEGLALAREIGLPLNEGILLHEYGRYHAARGETEEAAARFMEALAIFRRLGSKPWSERTERALSELDGRTV